MSGETDVALLVFAQVVDVEVEGDEEEEEVEAEPLG